MKKILLLIIVLLSSNQIMNAQCGKRKVTEFYPQKTTHEVTVQMMVYENGKTRVKGVQKQEEFDVTREWWETWFCTNKPKVLFDYWGCEECSDTLGTGFMVLKMGNTSVILFNYNKVPYAIFDAKVLANEYDYQRELFPDIYSSNKGKQNRADQVKYFQYLKTEFNSKNIFKLTTRYFESYSNNFYPKKAFR